MQGHLPPILPSRSLLNEPIVRHLCWNPDGNSWNVAGNNWSSILLPHLERVNLDRQSVMRANVVVTRIYHVFMRSIRVVRALKECWNLLVVINTSDALLSFAHPIDTAHCSGMHFQE